MNNTPNLYKPANPVVKGSLYEGITKREQACIALLIPESGDKELDDLIRKSRRQKLAGEVLAGMLSSETPDWAGAHDTNAESAIKQTDELIKQLGS